MIWFFSFSFVPSLSRPFACVSLFSEHDLHAPTVHVPHIFLQFPSITIVIRFLCFHVTCPETVSAYLSVLFLTFRIVFVRHIAPDLDHTCNLTQLLFTKGKCTVFSDPYLWGKPFTVLLGETLESGKFWNVPKIIWPFSIVYRHYR